MQKVAFVEPRCNIISQTGNMPSIRNLPMLGPLMLGTIIKKEGYDVEFIKEGVFKEYDYSEKDCDYLCLYSMTKTFPRAVKIAQEYKKTHPNGKVIFGGPHVSLMPEEALGLKFNGKYLIDYVVAGEGENVIIDVIHGKYKKRLVRGSPVENLDTLPSIDFSLLKNLPKKNIWFPISTSRGCPFRCKFCSVTKMFGTQFRFRSPGLVVKDIQDAEKHYKFKKIFFCDDNLFASPKQGKELLREMINYGINKDFFTQTRINVAKDDELLKLLSQVSPRVFLFLGLESIDNKALELYNKKQTLDDIKDSVNKIHDYGFKIVGNFVLGSDVDDKNTVKNTCDFCDDAEIDYPSFSVLTPLPGTDLYQELEKQRRIFTKNWSYYDLAHVVYHPKKMTPHELQERFIEGFDRLYSFSNKRIYKIILRDLLSVNCFGAIKTGILTLKSLKDAAKERQDYLKYLENIKK